MFISSFCQAKFETISLLEEVAFIASIVEMEGQKYNVEVTS